MVTSGRGKTNVEADVRLDQHANYSYTLGKGPRWVDDPEDACRGKQ